MNIDFQKELSLINNIEEEILKLKKEKDVIILAHYYQDSEIQDIADFIGDSLELSKKAKDNDSRVILFCGVKFMAEVAKIISPSKKVLIPDFNAGCSLESSCPPLLFSKFKAKNPDHIVVTYINCSAEIKAMSDIIVTSSNAKKIIDQLPKDQKIIFAPDKHLGTYINKITGRDMLLWDGSCIVHEQFSEKELISLTTKHPNAKVIAHPECPENLLNYANFIGSTSALINYVKNSGQNSKQDSKTDEFIVLTEPSIFHKMKQVNKNAILYDCPSINQAGCAFCNKCPHMQLNNLDKIYLALKYEKNSPFGGEILMDEELRLGAKKPLDKMLEMSN